MKTDLAQIFEFIIELDKLKAVLRKTKPLGLDRYENTAEHSWQICLLALTLAERAEPAVDTARVVELLLVHDIPEIDIGDEIVYQGKSAAKQQEERAAARRIFGLLPEPQAAHLLSRWQEFEDRLTPEACFAHAMDRLMPVLHNLYGNGQSWRENRVPLEKILSVNTAIRQSCPSVWAYVQERLRQLAEQGLFEYDKV